MKKTWEVWNELLEKQPSDLTDVESIVCRVNIFLVDFENGSWLYNLSPSTGEGRRWCALRETADSVAAVGVPAVASALRSIAEIVERSDIQKNSTWGEFLSDADPTNRIEDLSSSISAELSTIWQRLEEFTLKNFECESDQFGP